MLKIDLAHHAWPLMFKRRWIHPRNCQRCVFLPVFILRCSSLKPSIFSEWPVRSLLLKDRTLLQTLSAAPDFAFALFTALTPVFYTDAALDFQVGGHGERWWWEVAVRGRGVGGALCGARCAWSSTLTNCWKHIPRASATSTRQLLSMRWIAATHGFTASWRMLQVWRQADCFFLRLFGLFLQCCVFDTWWLRNSSRHNGTVDLHSRWLSHSFIWIQHKDNDECNQQFLKEKWNILVLVGKLVWFISHC